MLVKKNPSLKDSRISLPLVTNGITHGVSTTADLWIDPGDLVLVPEMMWGNYRMIFEVKKQAQLATYPVFNAVGEFDLEGFERAVVNAAKPRTKIMVILNSPHNPSGYAFSEKEGEKIVKILIAVANSGCHVVAVCDDAYFGLFYDSQSLKESLFARLTGTHPNLTAIKLDGGTKENYVWGLRVGFITFGSQTVSDTPALYDALTQKGAGCIRGTISNDSHLSQTIVLKSMQDERFGQETKAKFEVLKARAEKVKEVLQDPKFKDAWTAYPFNAGYFMCVKLKDVDAETLRLHLLDEYGVGVISLGKTDIRVAFSCLDIDEIPTIFDLLLQGITDLRKAGKTCFTSMKTGSVAKKKKLSFDLAYAGKWAFYFLIIGIIAGLGSILFHYLCVLGMHYFMDLLAGYRPPSPAGEHHLLEPSTIPFRRYMLFFLPAMGGLFSGWLVYTFAPEAEGHGTDAAIDAYHNKGGKIRARVPIIKTIASAVTLTTGGSGGREGPIAQIGAGFGSFLATRLKLSHRERRIMMAAGIGAGVGSIFRAPLAGALFAAEVLYRDPEFEAEVIIPAGIASVVAYCVFCLVFGWGTLFAAPDFVFRNPMELIPYLALAGVLVGTGFLYVKSFYGITGFFHRLHIPNHLKPAIGGLATGAIGVLFPHTLAFGYGYIQQALTDLHGISILFLLTLAVGKIFTTSFSIGSGGSGGVFGPSVVIGGAMGGAVGKVFHKLMPTVVTEPGSFIIVGMAGFFAGCFQYPYIDHYLCQ